MKRNFISKKLFAGIIAGLTMVAGLSAKDARLGVKVKKNADNATVIDWTDRALGEVSAPTWLKNIRRGNASTFKKDWDIDSSRIVKVSMATGKTEATAQALSRSGFAYAQAAELNQKVIGRVGQGLNDDGQLEALFVAASETKAEMAGLREETQFWQKVRTTKKDEKRKKITEEKYIYYTVYSMDKTTWDRANAF